MGEECLSMSTSFLCEAYPFLYLFVFMNLCLPVLLYFYFSLFSSKCLLSLCPSVSLSLVVPVSFFLCPSIYMSLCSQPYFLSVFRSICLSVSPVFYLSISLSLYCIAVFSISLSLLEAVVVKILRLFVNLSVPIRMTSNPAPVLSRSG